MSPVSTSAGTQFEADEAPQADSSQALPASGQAEAAPPPAAGRRVHALIIGTGFSGLGMAARLQDDGIEDFLLLERADDVGGTWRDNTYPGAACDVPSQLYSFSFALNPTWSRSFSQQPEIQSYLQQVTTERGLWDKILLRHTVDGATWDEAAQRWQVTTENGARFSARFLLMAAGSLSDPAIPPLPGLADFQGKVFHSARWDHEHDLTGERVAAVGTGASSIQFVPRIQPEVEHLTLFQRTPPWIIPRMDRPVTAAERWAYARVPGAQRAVRSAIYWARETYAIGFTKQPAVLKVAEKLARLHLRRQVPDEALRATLTPDYKIGCKRILISSDYYPALSQPNVTVEATGVKEVRAHSVVGENGVEHEVDTIVFGTGFKVTDLPMARWLRGTDGTTLADVWARDGMRAHMGTTVPGFPNAFLIVGPNTGVGHTSQVFMIEQQIGFVADALAAVTRQDAGRIEVREPVLDAFDAELQDRMSRTVWTTGGCGSWYIDETGRNTTLWPDFTFQFRRRMSRFEIGDYELADPTDDGAGTPAARVGAGTGASA